MAASVQFQDLIAGGGVVLKAAGLVAADTAETGVFVGKGWMIIDLTWTACEIASSDEFYNVQFQFNTQDATSTWLDDISIPFGDTLLLGGAADTSASGQMIFGLHNPYDHQVRVNTWVTGTIATGFNFAVTAYPMKMGDF